MSEQLSPKNHWESVYSRHTDQSYSWYQEYPQNSLKLISKTNISKAANIIDIGGGDSNLVDNLLAADYENVAVLDISAKALASAQSRLGLKASQVEWIEADVTTLKTNKQYSVWHDRAVFHFLTKPKQRQAYKDRLIESLKPGGHLILATFALGGPKRCSGLDIVQYDVNRISMELGERFVLQETEVVIHKTPTGAEQQFNYFWFLYRNA